MRKELKILLFVLILAISLIAPKFTFAQENPEDLELCTEQDALSWGDVDTAEQCVIRDCDCNRRAQNGKVGELICMEARPVKNDQDQVQYKCKQPNSATGASCDTIGIKCPGASNDSSGISDDAVTAQTSDPNAGGLNCEEKLLEWEVPGKEECDSQYNRYVAMNRWQSSVYDPQTGKCKEFFLPNRVLEDSICDESLEGKCERKLLQDTRKICLSDGAEAYEEEWQDEKCNKIKKVGRLTGETCKKDDVQIDVTSALQGAAAAKISAEAQEWGININLGFRDRSTVKGQFKLKINADDSAGLGEKTIWDIAAVWLDGIRLTLNPNNYNENNFDLSSINSDMVIYLVTTKVSENSYELDTPVSIEFGDGNTRTGNLYVRIDPSWVGTDGPKTIEQMVNTLDKATVINPYNGEYFSVTRDDIMTFAKATIPGQIPDEEMVFSVNIPIKFRDGSEIKSNSTLTVRKNPNPSSELRTIWDITGIEFYDNKGVLRNLTLNPDNIQSNNFTFWQNPDVLESILNMEMPTQYTEIPMIAWIVFKDGTKRDAELKVILNPVNVTSSSPKKITQALGNIQELTVADPYDGTVYSFDANLIRAGVGQVVNVSIPYGAAATVPIKYVSVDGAFRTSNITLVYEGDDSNAPSQAQVDQDSQGSGSTVSSDNSGGQDNVQVPADLGSLVKVGVACLVRDGEGCIDIINPLKCINSPKLNGPIYVGIKFPNKTRYFGLDKPDIDLGNPSGDEVRNKFWLGIFGIGESNGFSLVSPFQDKNQMKLPLNIKTLPVGIQDKRNPNDIKTYSFEADEVDFKPKGC